MTTTQSDNIVFDMKELCLLMRYDELQEVDSQLQQLEQTDDSFSFPNVHVNGESILHVAAECAIPEPLFVRLLIFIDIDFCRQPNDQGDTPLHSLCRQGNDPATIRLLAQQCPQDLQKPNLANKTPLSILLNRIDEGNLYESDVADVILAIAQVNPDLLSSVDDATRESLLHQAISHSYSNEDFCLIKMLLRENSGLASMVDTYGATPLHIAAACTDADAAKRLDVLLQTCDSDQLCFQDFSGQTPLHLACQTFLGSTTRNVIKVLVSQNANALHLRDENGLTPFATFRDFHQDHLLTRVNYTMHTWNETQVKNIADCFMTLMMGEPVRCSDGPALHDLLHHEQCCFDVAGLVIYALRNQVTVCDANGNLALHIVAATPVSNDDRQAYLKVIELLLHLDPNACRIPNNESQLPLECMLHWGKTWETGMKLVLTKYPAAVLDLHLNSFVMSTVMERLGKEAPDALFRLLQGAPELVQGRS